MRNKNLKYKLVRNIATITAIAGLSYALNTYNVPENKIPYTKQDTITNVTFSAELQNIMNTNHIEFQNEELYNLIEQKLGQTPTKENLSTITKLEIQGSLTNNDLSDLKYLQNLKTLEISNNAINLSDLKYNQNLYCLRLNNCTFKNTTDIPNTTNSLIITNSICQDNPFITPYFLKTLYLDNTPIQNLTLKNPSTLEELHIIGDSIIDLNNIKSCNNLKKLTIKLCSNIINSNVLSYLSSLENIELDDYASVWLTNDTLSTLPLKEELKSHLQQEIKQLDETYNTITQSSKTTEDKVKSISLYVLDQLTYDENIKNDYEGNMARVYEYNANPINMSLNSGEGICINYACLFKALLNRTGLENYQLFSDIHTWNIILDENGYKGYDLTYLDDTPLVKLNSGKIALVSDATVDQIINDNNENLLYYYEFNLDEITDEDHLAKLTPQEIQDIIVNIGYIKENNITKVTLNNNDKITKINSVLKILLIVLISNTFINVVKNKKTKEEIYKR